MAVGPHATLDGVGRFQACSPLGRRLVDHRQELQAVAQERGYLNLRVFGSLARAQDGPESDIDLLVTSPADAGIFALSALELEFQRILGTCVDVVADFELDGTTSRQAIVQEAVPL